MSRYAFAAAGTGGHVYPALAVAAELVARGVAPADIVFFGGRRMEATVVPEAGYPFVALPLQGLQRSLSPQNLRIPLVVAAAARRARRELLARRVRAVLATGGYVTVPVGWGARRSGTPLFLQEQNAVPGLANKVAARWADGVFLAFPAAAAGLSGEVTGNPLRPEFNDYDRTRLRPAAWERYGISRGPVLGVLGGSLGARVINEAVVQFAAAGEASDVSIVHLAGTEHAGGLRRTASESRLPWSVLPFEDSMQFFYAAADLVLCRAGALTVSELAATGTPSVLVPRAIGSAAHQDRNAEFLAGAGAARVISESDAGDTLGVLGELLSTPATLRVMAEAAAGLGRPEATVRIADVMVGAARD